MFFMQNIFKLKTLVLVIFLSNNAYSDYQVIVPLDPKGIIMEETPINGNISLSPNSINRGGSSTLSWNYEYANEVDIKGLGKYGKVGSITVSPLASRNYEIEVTKGSQKKIENLFLTVIQPNQNITFNADKLRVGIGQPVNLSWDVENAEYVDIDNGIGNGLPLNGNLDVYPTIDTTFMLTAKGYEGVSDATEYLTIDVVNNSVINSFNASELNITKGDSVVFNWDVTDSEGLNLNPYGSVSGTPTGSQNITFNNSGIFDFTLESTSLNGTIVSSSPININVYNPAVINSYTINGSSTTIDASPNDPLNFVWDVSDAVSYKLNGNVINDTTTSLVASSTTGTTQYTLEAFNGAGDSVSQSLSVNVVGIPVIDSFTSPTSVFANTPLTLSWTGTGVSKYEIKSNNAASGISTTSVDLGSSLSANATPTTAGSFTYTLSAYNTANSKVDSTKTVVVESNPTFTGFTVNGSTSVTVTSNTALTFAGTGFSTGANLQGRNSSNTSTATLPSTAPTTGGTYTYYASATKTLNGITRNSGVRSVTVNVENWVATTPTYTNWVNSGEIYGCSNWSPDPSTVTSGQTFTQTATDCEQDQTRTRQNREQETTTLVYKNVGSPITETQTLNNQTNTKTATGTKLITGCVFEENNTYWSESTGMFTSQNIWYSGEKIWPTGDSYLEFAPIFTNYTYNGYKYTRGSFINSIQDCDYGVCITTKIYKACRVSI
jgi:hypothetical protein